MAANDSETNVNNTDNTNNTNNTNNTTTTTTTTTNNNNNNNLTDNSNDSKTDEANLDYYFDSYSHFGIHEEMLKDKIRTQAYQKAITMNPHLFQGKTVLDIGAGTGILCLFAAKAGAKKVYGIECATISRHAKKIVIENGYENVIEIIQGKVEEIELPVQQVDIIISEWMGYFLLYESMLNTVLYARDKWLAPNGIIMPDKARLIVCAIEDGKYMNEKINFWDNVYGFKMQSLKEEAISEPLVDVVPSKSVISDTYCVLNLDLYKVKVEQLNFQSTYQLKFKFDEYCHAIVAFFDVLFSKCHTRIGLTTSPFGDYTHWKQTVFYLDRPLMATKGSMLYGKISVEANKKNPRCLDITLENSYEWDRNGKIDQKRLYLMR